MSRIAMNEEIQKYVQDHTEGFLDLIPDVRYLRDKHNRLAYLLCKEDQTYSRFQYVTNEYANKIQGRLLRNVLSFIPSKY